jgi:hypothetical protein
MKRLLELALQEPLSTQYQISIEKFDDAASDRGVTRDQRQVTLPVEES